MSELERITSEIHDIERGFLASNPRSAQVRALSKIRWLLLRLDRGFPVSGTDFLLAVALLPPKNGRRRSTEEALSVP
jgi:hypothetical protein